MMRTFIAAGLIVFVAAPAFAQGRSLEGTTVRLKMDMPGTSDGVDVYPNDGGVDFRKVADRLKSAGIGVHTGDSIMITKVILKKDHIEVQLGGGGYGTFSDALAQMGTTPPPVPYQYKSRREKDLENEAKYSDDYWQRREARDELHDERQDRARDNAMAATINAQAQQVQQANIRQLRAQSGSRFNIRYRGTLPEGAATPQSIMEALDRYVDFGDGGSFAPSPSQSPSRTTGAAPSGGANGGLRKGLTVQQVEQIYGPASRINQQKEGSMEIAVREYDTDDGQHVSARFVGGVVIDYQIGPR